ncbi:GspMb/PilO family protein [Halopseudomonas sp. Lyrl_26]|uniref:GspMb/PilO family protein n=1 Tax=Halopseudomonas sp. Lyrl_26 TaxID=3110923 RepID=UPI003F8021C2
MKTDLQRQWRQLRQQWQANPRLRLLAAVVVLILLFSVLQHLHQIQSQARQDAQRQWQRLGDVQQLSQEQHWQQHAEQTQAALQELKQQLWHAASEGQAQAQLRDLLQQALNRHGLSAIRINVTSLLNEQGDLLQVRADVNGDYQPGAWQDLMHDLAQHTPRLIIEHDSVNRTNARRHLYRIGLHAWFIIGEES